MTNNAASQDKSTGAPGGYNDDSARRCDQVSGYTMILFNRISAAREEWEELHREVVTPQTLADFRSGKLLKRVKRVDQGGLMCMARVTLYAPDGAELDTYTGPHPDEGPDIYREVSAASRRSIANVWAALVSGADPGPVPDRFDGDIRDAGEVDRAATYVAQHAWEMK